MAEISLKDFYWLLPEIVLAVSGMLLLVVGAVRRTMSNRQAVIWALLALVLTLVALVAVQQGVSEPLVILAGNFVVDGYAFFWKLLFLVATALTLGLSARFLEDSGYRPTEFYALLLLATTGMMLMVGGYNLLSIWISLELMALSSYILAGYFKHELKSNEAALKYFILGALSSGVLLYGVSLLYGATGTVQLTEVAARLPEALATGELMVAMGWLLLAVGLFFKVAAVPFHVWTPDVYVGAPTPVTAYLAVASKAASFAILLRIFYIALPPVKLDWQLVVAAVAVLSMIWGNIAALTQSVVKRMLAYSSIAHAGYVLIGVLAASEIGLWSVMFYMLTYTFVTMGVFGVVVLLERKEYAGETYADYAGLARRSPFLAAMMLFFMLALTGIPPTGGFVGKVYLFASAVEAGWSWVALVGVLTSAISLYYYFGIVVNMYFKDADDNTPTPLDSPALVAAISVCAVATLVLGLFPGPVIDFAKSSLLALP